MVPRIKICGITRAEDAHLAADLGAWAVGFIFWPGSGRSIDPQRARDIVRGLPPFVVPVGVFVNQPAADVEETATFVRLGAVQLHGEETPDAAAAVAHPVIKAIAIGGDAHAWPAHVRLLLDVDDRAARGGTGRTIDWAAAAGIAATRRILLAGGLTPDNVADAIARVRPFGIDVSSGVERAPGIKDHGRLRALFEAIHDSGHITARS